MDPFADQALQGELGHVASPEYHDASSMQRSENFLCELHSRRAHRRGAPADARFGPRARGREERRLEQPVQHRPRMRAALLPRRLDLAVNLRLAQYHRVQAGRDAEQMHGSLALPKLITDGCRVSPEAP